MSVMCFKWHERPFQKHMCTTGKRRGWNTKSTENFNFMLSMTLSLFPPHVWRLAYFSVWKFNYSGVQLCMWSEIFHTLACPPYGGFSFYRSNGFPSCELQSNIHMKRKPSWKSNNSSSSNSASQQTKVLVQLIPYNAAICDLLAFKFWCEKKNEHLNHRKNYPNGIHTVYGHQSDGYYYNLYVSRHCMHCACRIIGRDWWNKCVRVYRLRCPLL